MRTNPPPTYHIIYGFLGGDAHGSELRKKLNGAGFQFAKDPSRVDLLIAHSAGCHLLPEINKVRLLMLVGMPLQISHTTRTFLKANRYNLKSRIDNQLVLKGIWLGLKSAFYGLRQPRRNFLIARKASIRIRLPDQLNTKVLFIMNRDDPWPKSALLDQVINEHPYCYISLGGSHDNIWEAPENYVDIIKAYADRLLA